MFRFYALWIPFFEVRVLPWKSLLKQGHWEGAGGGITTLYHCYYTVHRWYRVVMPPCTLPVPLFEENLPRQHPDLKKWDPPKYCRIMARRILNNTISSMITSDPQSRMFWCSTSVWQSCFRADTISLKTSDALRSPICIFVQVSFLFTPQNWACSMMPHSYWPSST